MSFEWSQYLNLAKELAHTASTSASQEARLRAVIHLAYYAAFNLAKDHLRDKEGYSIPTTSDTHNYVSAQFQLLTTFQSFSMNATLKITLFLSLLINILFLLLTSVLAAKRGGLLYILHKISLRVNSKSRITAMYDTPFYRDKKTHFETLPQSSAEIIFLGDSLTDLCEWSELFGHDRIKNRGICGDTTEGILNRINTIIESKSQKLFLMIGINDITQGRKVGDVLNSYKQILKNLQYQRPETKVFIQSILPVNNQKFPNHGVNKKIIEVNAALQELAKEFSFQYIDLFSSFLDRNHQLDDRYTSDGVHLNGQGYLIWKEIIEKDVVN